MKATGIVRRIDDLGRVVIPKEIRRTLRIREGEPMEIFTDSGGSVIFKKYSPAAEQELMAGQLCEAVYRDRRPRQQFLFINLRRRGSITLIQKRTKCSPGHRPTAATAG